jgi:hypothetical protein
MKKYLFLTAFVFANAAAFAQVGIGNTTPKSQLDISAGNPASPTIQDGILIPRINLFPANPTIDQNSMMVYLTTTSAGKPPGFYYWDNAAATWKGFGGTTISNGTAIGNTMYWDGTTWVNNSGFLYNNGTSIGVNTTSPSSVLAVKQNGIGFTQEDTTGNSKIGFFTVNGNAWLQTHSDTDLSFATSNGPTQMVLQKTTGNLGINTLSPSEKLEVAGKTKTTDLQVTNGAGTGKILISDTVGNATWQTAAAFPGWTTTGNAGTNPATNFIGTTDDKDLVFKRFNTVSGKIGTTNTSFGVNTLPLNAIGNNNTAIGASALHGSAIPADNTGNNNTAIGYQSLLNTSSGSGNSAVGDRALTANTTGGHNNAFGYLSLAGNTTGSQNNAHGSEVLLVNTTGSYNSGFGYRSLNSNNGNYNSAFGNSSLLFNTMASNNVGMGYRALGNQGFTNGGVAYDTNNVAVGVDALSLNNPTTTANGIGNTAVGNVALSSNLTGRYSTAVGYRALFTNTIGDFNTALGYNVYPLTNNLSNYTGIGYNVGGGTSASNMVEIGNTSVTSIRGQVTFTTYSDKRIKNNIRHNVPGLSFINKLRPVTYNLDIHKQNDILYKDKKESDADWNGKYDIENITQTGFIAQEVVQAAKESNFDFSGIDAPKNNDGLYGLRYAEFVVPLVKAVQEQQETIDAEKEKNAQLAREIETLKNNQQQLERRLKAIEEKWDK